MNKLSDYDRGFADALETFLDKFEKNPMAALGAAYLTVQQAKKEQKKSNENN